MSDSKYQQEILQRNRGCSFTVGDNIKLISPVERKERGNINSRKDRKKGKRGRKEGNMESERRKEEKQ